ncbi:MAG: FAD-binding oxidoreductase [Clostridia bacterium]|nr:FAD-binding oxidoreductase [Clostridia bacterium]
MLTSADVVIIGGGISGCSAAYSLARKGVRNIVVLEKRFICGGSTGACGAGVRMQWGTRMNCMFSKYSIEYYERANELLEYEGDIEFKQSGYLLIADTDREIEQFKRNIEVQRECGIPSRMLSLDEARAIVPHLNTEILKGAAFCEKDGFLNPFHTTDAFYRAAKRLGVRFEVPCVATGIEVEHGRIAAVLTDKGRIATRCVVNCAGGYSKDICAMAGVDVPVYRERHQILVTEPVEPMQGPMVMAFGLNLYVQQSPHGSFIMGRGDNSEPRDGRVTSSWQFLDEMARTVTRVLPPLGKLRVVRQWAGLYNMTPDRQPIYEKSDQVEGLYMAIGFSGHGFMFGPVTGAVVSEMVLGEEPTIDASRLSLKRFERGEMVFEPSVV